jgi:K+-sensing histidine kinase KdpD
MLKVGQRFQTFNNEQDQNSKGIGLGLAICQEMINQMGSHWQFILWKLGFLGILDKKYNR